MKKILLPIFLLVLISCSSRKETKTTPQADVPKALQDNKESNLISISKRKSYDRDLVEELYKEKMRSTPALQEIETLTDKLNDAENDSLEIYNDFKAKNQQYYSSASSHLNLIKDSSLKKEIENVIEKSTLAYNNKISGFEDLTTILNKKIGSADDRHSALMILISLGMMKEYQEKNMPSSKPIESVINDYNRLIQKMDSVINKNK
jgi:hypothetical protein